MNYIISYDLNSQERDYEKLIEAIKLASNGIWSRPCESTWIIQSDYQTSDDLHKYLEKALDFDYAIIIASLAGDIKIVAEKSIVDYIEKTFILE